MSSELGYNHEFGYFTWFDDKDYAMDLFLDENTRRNKSESVLRIFDFRSDFTASLLGLPVVFRVQSG